MIESWWAAHELEVVVLGVSRRTWHRPSGFAIFVCVPCDEEHPRSGRLHFDGGRAPSRMAASGSRRGGCG